VEVFILAIGELLEILEEERPWERGEISVRKKGGVNGSEKGLVSRAGDTIRPNALGADRFQRLSAP
jgi:hypothetical protein